VTAGPSAGPSETFSRLPDAVPSHASGLPSWAILKLALFMPSLANAVPFEASASTPAHLNTPTVQARHLCGMLLGGRILVPEGFLDDALLVIDAAANRDGYHAAARRRACMMRAGCPHAPF